MSRPGGSVAVYGGLLGAILGVAVASWMFCSSAPVSPPPVFKIAEHGRLILSRDEIPSHGSIALILSLGGVARGDGHQPIRIVSEDGRRLDAMTTPVAEDGGGLRVEIDSEFFSTGGHYMLQVESAERHPLNLLRFVIDVR
jgi:hypothetical protein